MIDWESALEIAVEKTGHNHFRTLCSDDNPNAFHRQGCRDAVVRIAAGDMAPQYPPLLAQLATAAGAIGRVIDNAVHRQPITRTPNEQAACLESCRACEHFDGSRCKLCGCLASLKTRLLSEHCPLPQPKW